jgi:phosphonate transport system substrate-binding protein
MDAGNKPIVHIQCRGASDDPAVAAQWRKKMKRSLAILRRTFLLMLVFVGMPASADSDTVYTLATIPAAPPVAMNALWTPFVERLSASTGYQFRLRHYERMAEFERDIWGGGPDFIFSSPIQIVVAHMTKGYVPLVRARKLVAIGLFVRDDSPVRNVQDLSGKKISFVGNKNLCSVAMQHMLAKHGEKLNFDKEYAGSTRNVLINVLMGKVDAGAVFLPEMDRETDETRRQLREVIASPDMAPHPLSANPRVPRKVQEAVTKAVLDMAASADGAALLKKLKLDDPVLANYQKDYAALEEIDIKGLTNWGQ